MSDTLIIAVVSAIAAISAATLTAILGRRNSLDTNRVDTFEATLAGMEKLIAAQDKRITTLERGLVTEQQQHNETRELLRVAMRHIRDMLSWLGGDRHADPPTVPAELTHQL